MGSQLSPSQVDNACRRVYSRYPDLRGVRPRISRQRSGGQDRFVLSFEARVDLPDGASLPMVARAVLDADGRVLKLTSSR